MTIHESDRLVSRDRSKYKIRFISVEENYARKYAESFTIKAS